MTETKTNPRAAGGCVCCADHPISITWARAAVRAAGDLGGRPDPILVARVALDDARIALEAALAHQAALAEDARRGA